MRNSKINNKKIICLLVVAAVMSGLFTGCNSANPTDNRETTYAGETKDTVDPYVSQPQQSIASDPLITETTTETTEAPTSFNTYNLRGKEFTLSVHLEDYIYELDGSDYKYFNLEEFMGHYGMVNKSTAKYIDMCTSYGDDSFLIYFDTDSSMKYSPDSGNNIPNYIDLRYENNSLENIDALKGAGDIENCFEINGYFDADKGKSFSTWCLSWEQIIVLGVILDDYAQTGCTDGARDALCEVLEDEGGGVSGGTLDI